MRKIGALLVSALLALAPLSAVAATHWSAEFDFDNHYVPGEIKCDLYCTHTWTDLFQVGDALVISGSGINGTYHVTGFDHNNGTDNIIVTPNFSETEYGRNATVSTVDPAPAAPSINFGWANGGGTAAVVSGVGHVIGGNFDGLAVIAGLIVGVPLAFYIIERIIGWFKMRDLAREHTRELVELLGAENVYVGGRSIADISKGKS